MAPPYLTSHHPAQRYAQRKRKEPIAFPPLLPNDITGCDDDANAMLMLFISRMANNSIFGWERGRGQLVPPEKAFSFCLSFPNFIPPPPLFLKI
jgi:hypothetical protein